jgi:hypothetical protein
MEGKKGRRGEGRRKKEVISNMKDTIPKVRGQVQELPTGGR